MDYPGFQSGVDTIRMKMQKAVILLALSIFCQGASALRIERLIMPGDLVQGHKKFEDTCEKCHVNFAKEAQTGLCRECHEDVDLDIIRKQGFHGTRVIRNRACTDCHTDHEGRNADIVKFDASVFAHEQTDFVLKGKHKNLICNDCHKDGEKFREAANECYGCHREDDPHKKLLGRECSDCHTEESWHKTEFDHDKTDFPLKGKH